MDSSVDEDHRWRVGWRLVLTFALLIEIAVFDAVLSSTLFPMTALVIPPLIASTFATPVETGFVGAAAITLGVLARGEPNGLWGAEHLLRIVVIATVAVVAVLLARGRRRRERVLAVAARRSSLMETLQVNLLPRVEMPPTPVAVSTRSVAGEPLMLLGGDFFDVVTTPAGSVAFVIGDVAGRGAEQAALGAALRAGWRALALAGNDPASTVEVLDHVAATAKVDDSVFVTVCAGDIAADARLARVVCAGHPPPVLLTQRGVEVVEVPTGLPMGIASGQRREMRELPLPECWSLLAYTDGLVEGSAGHPGAERFGIERVAALLRRLHEPCRVTGDDLDALLSEIHTANGAPLQDDVAVVLMQHTPPLAAGTGGRQPATA